jgi:uncharacterized caspase-like protein
MCINSRRHPRKSSFSRAARQEACACTSVRLNINVAIRGSETYDEAGMLEFVFFGFSFFTVLVFVMAYWPKKPAARSAPSAAAAPSRAVKTGPTKGRVALVIGNGAYTSVDRLKNPANDASAVAGALTRLGFDVVKKQDLGVLQMQRALRDFEDEAGGAEWALVYYAGHGLEQNGKNWLIPVDAELTRATDLPDEAIPVDRVLDRLSGGRKLRIVILDACRTNPFLARMVMNGAATRAVAQGLAAIDPTHGEVVFYAARDGSVAADGPGGANSPFTAAFVKHMEEEGVELGRFFRKVTSSVLAETNNRQEPFVYGRIPDEEFFFKPAA